MIAHLLQSIFPESEVRGRAVLSVVLDHLATILIIRRPSTYKQSNHAIRVHALSDVELKVLEVGNNLLCESLCTLLECGDSLRVGFLELGLDGLHVALEVGQVGLRDQLALHRQTSRVCHGTLLASAVGCGDLGTQNTLPRQPVRIHWPYCSPPYDSPLLRRKACI